MTPKPRPHDAEVELLGDVFEMVSLIAESEPVGPYALWTPETGWILCEPEDAPPFRLVDRD